MPLAGSTLLLRQYSLPACVSWLLDFFFLLLVAYKSTFNGYLGRMIAIKECSVDFYTRYLPACRAQPQDYPVRRLSVVTSGFPTIIPGSCMCEDSGSANRGGRGYEVLGCCEPFVAEGEDLGPERCGYEICMGSAQNGSAENIAMLNRTYLYIAI